MSEVAKVSEAVTGAEVRPLRSDAARNRDALLGAASELFAERGADAPLEEIARRAGVGIGTLYRHFPTREALIAAVYRREVDLLCSGADGLLATRAPDQALQDWMEQFVRYVGLKKGLAMTLKATEGHSELFAYSHALIRDTIGRLADAGARAGSIRPGVEPADLMRALGGFCSVTDQPGWDATAVRLVGLLVDGLRYQPAHRADLAPR